MSKLAETEKTFRFRVSSLGFRVRVWFRLRLCNEDGTWDVSGMMEGVAVIGGDAASAAAATALGWAPSRALTWRHVLDVERRAKPHLGLAVEPGRHCSPRY
jgi:hypothetical protein